MHPHARERLWWGGISRLEILLVTRSYVIFQLQLLSPIFINPIWMSHLTLKKLIRIVASPKGEAISDCAQDECRTF